LLPHVRHACLLPSPSSLHSILIPSLPYLHGNKLAPDAHLFWHAYWQSIKPPTTPFAYTFRRAGKIQTQTLPLQHRCTTHAYPAPVNLLPACLVRSYYLCILHTLPTPHTSSLPAGCRHLLLTDRWRVGEPMLHRRAWTGLTFICALPGASLHLLSTATPRRGLRPSTRHIPAHAAGHRRVQCAVLPYVRLWRLHWYRAADGGGRDGTPARCAGAAGRATRRCVLPMRYRYVAASDSFYLSLLLRS